MRIFFYIFFIITSVCLQAQIKESFIRYSYELTYLDRLDNDSKYNSICYLDIYTDKSYFGDKYFIEFQNIWAINDTIKDQNKRYNVLADAKAKYSGQAFSFLLKKQKNTVTQYKKIWTEAFYVEQDANKIIWTIDPTIRTWNNFVVQQATAFFEGRKWNVLFTKDLNLINGPYKFTNLPGFVVKAWDENNHYIFEFINSEKITVGYNYLARIHKYKKVTEAEYMKLNKNYFNKTYRVFWGETQPNVEQFEGIFPLDKKIGDIENSIDLSYKN